VLILRLSHSFVFSCAMMRAPALPACSLRPVCSGCQCVLNSVCSFFAPVDFSASFSTAADCGFEPPSTSSRPSGPLNATTLASAPVISFTPPPRSLAAGAAVRACTCSPVRVSKVAPATAVCRKSRRVYCVIRYGFLSGA
jgi:hypothetical protein